MGESKNVISLNRDLQKGQKSENLKTAQILTRDGSLTYKTPQKIIPTLWKHYIMTFGKLFFSDTVLT